MALTPIDEVHALQIQAGTLGRKTGHAFEDAICAEINLFEYPFRLSMVKGHHLFCGNPAMLFLHYVMRYYGEEKIYSASAISTGALATSEDGRKWLQINGSDVRRCKSDIVVTIAGSNGELRTVGVSTKQCNNNKPTNAQLYFTTARGFARLLRENQIDVSDDATNALRMFCGDNGFRPLDEPSALDERQVDPRRYFWEELPTQPRSELEMIFGGRQDEITQLLLQKAYFDDPFVPDFLIHKTKQTDRWDQTEVAIYAISELVALSRTYQGFATKPYSVRKGSYRDPNGISHLAPRFGVVQMQRGGQAQHPEQLQFNLEAGYFYRLENL